MKQGTMKVLFFALKSRLLKNEVYLQKTDAVRSLLYSKQLIIKYTDDKKNTG